MTTRWSWHVAAAGTIGVTLLLSGCAQHPKKRIEPTGPVSTHSKDTVANTAPTTQPSGAESNAGSVEASEGSADALARKSQAYAEELLPALRNRQQAKPSTESSRAGSRGGSEGGGGEAGSVAWADPGDFSLAGSGGGAPQANAAVALPTKPAADAGQSARSGAGPSSPSSSSKPDAPAAPKYQLATETSDALLKKLAKRIQEYPRDISGHLEYQLLEFLLDEPSPQMPLLAPLQSEDREMVAAVLDGLSNFRNALRADNNMLLSKKIKPILEMADRLRSQAELTIPTIVLCRKVYGFGNYDPIEPATFPAGQVNQAIVYCEVANFTPILNAQRMWETRVNWDMTLYSAGDATPVWTEASKSLTDVSRTSRKDFFVNAIVKFPQTLPVGKYLLKVTIVDTQSSRIAEATLPMLIAAR